MMGTADARGSEKVSCCIWTENPLPNVQFEFLMTFNFYVGPGDLEVPLLSPSSSVFASTMESR